MLLVNLAIGLAMLVFGAELLVRGGSQLALQLRVPALVVGLTVVSAGTSAPELVVSTAAALDGSSDIALSNVSGSNIANILLVLGLSGLVAVIPVDGSMIRRDIPVLIGLSAMVPALSWDGTLGRLDGAVLLTLGVLYNAWLLYDVMRGRAKLDDGELEAEQGSAFKYLAFVVVGLVVLILGANRFVEGAMAVARLANLSERFIGLTVVAVGTSAPEIAASVMSAVRGEADLAVGNSVGSNIFNICLVLGVASMITPMSTTSPGVIGDMITALLVATSMVLFVFLGRIGRVEGAVLCSCYAGYVAWGLFA